MTKCVVSDNTRPSGSGCGGGVYLAHAGARIEDSLIVRNHDPSYGGGMVFYDGGSGSKQGGTAVNCTIAMNSSARGNEAYGNSGRGVLVNCIVFNEQAQNLLWGKRPVFSNCYSSADLGGSNKVVTDSYFVDLNKGDYRPRLASPSTGVGCPSVTLTNLPPNVRHVSSPVVQPTGETERIAEQTHAESSSL